MRYILDTQVILWWYFDSKRLAKEHLKIIADEGNELYVSAASIWEIEVKRRNGKLEPKFGSRGFQYCRIANEPVTFPVAGFVRSGT